MLVSFFRPATHQLTSNAPRAAPVAHKARIPSRRTPEARARREDCHHGRIKEGRRARGLAATAEAERTNSDIAYLDLDLNLGLDLDDRRRSQDLADVSAGPGFVGRGLPRPRPRRRAHGDPSLRDPSPATGRGRGEAAASEREARGNDSELPECVPLRKVEKACKTKLSFFLFSLSSSSPAFCLFLQDGPASKWRTTRKIKNKE